MMISGQEVYWGKYLQLWGTVHAYQDCYVTWDWRKFYQEIYVVSFLWIFYNRQRDDLFGRREMWGLEMLLTGSVLTFILVFVAGAFFFYLLNGISYLVPREMGLVEGYKAFFDNGFHIRYAGSVITGGIIAVLAGRYFYTPAAVITVILFLGLLLIVGTVDWVTMEIPDFFVAAAFVLGLVSVFTLPETSFLSRIIGIFAVSVPLLLLTLAVPGAFGGGDIKLMAGCGLFLGTKLCLLSLAFAVLTGGMYGIWLLTVRKKSGKEHFAFGPFLCVGMAAALFVGDWVLNWYMGFLY